MDLVDYPALEMMDPLDHQDRADFQETWAKVDPLVPWACEDHRGLGGQLGPEVQPECKAVLNCAQTPVLLGPPVIQAFQA